MNPARENILARVRQALHHEAHRPPAPTAARIWPVLENLPERFRQEFTALRGEIIGTPEQLQAFLQSFKNIATDGSGLVQEFAGADSVPVRIADLGITGCDCVIAQTGSIAVSTLSAGGRALSVLPPTHLVIARRDQLVPDLAAAIHLWQQRYSADWPSHLCLITGPSRTSDIEKTLVMGAHGPKRLALYFVD